MAQLIKNIIDVNLHMAKANFVDSTKELASLQRHSMLNLIDDTFDDTKLGVKGLVDAGIVNIPKKFVRPAEDLAEELDRPKSHIGIPVVDLGGLLTTDLRRKIVDEIRIASEKWGFFQVVNHGIPIAVLDNMIARIRTFNERDIEAKKEFYGRDRARQVNFNSNYDLFQSQTAGWRDSLIISLATSGQIDPNDLPDACRSIECNEGKRLLCHYYPECPEPDLAIGITKHSDNSFLTIVAQDQTGGLQVLHKNQFWVDVEPIPGALVVNIGDFLQLVSNDKFKSNMHRVLPSHKPRVSAAFFFCGRFAPPARERMYGPIRELTSEENPPKYREVLFAEYFSKFYSKGLHEKLGLDE
ncbi:hypothetical protein TIFTF001_022585 [Ficus carica]|uniref:Fe2OG dioxygenase domain-containing protein n=1 Tax=Ficus carica TaxID=3494 RepID=A0AA88AES0_FICCA|nr:hypothetical protein TIFTF001_022585 [Ficus carica]